jgi:hypothetical protein
MIYTKMDINEIRRANMRRLAANYKNRAEFARVLGRSEQQLYHLIGKKNPKNIGNRIARDVEDKLGLKTGSLDILQEPSTSGPATARDGVNLELLEDCITAIEEAIAEQGITNMPASKKSQAIALAYSATLASNQNQVVSVDFIVRTLSR